ncbi:putative transcriptional regulator [Bacillus ectoiniformans]|uniref:hypothetical protein n=1 Tax=Bacillus ectoiniformans TaxID=1494429 RepID=UPI001957A707|nr:hypothetical protein [Bacillus ectoiniformans]MBM7650217.1 putative transcriptional regulator [Bacillus ectoiniformans]
MGGTETIRGILFQALICCKEVFEREWKLVSFEPSFENKEIDKVDILFIDNDKKTHAIQVKSSINPFGEADLKRWIKSLKEDFKSDYYELQLVGTLKANANKYINNLNKDSNIKIVITPFNVGDVEKQIVNLAKNFLDEKNIGSNEKALKNNIKILSYEVLKSSISNEKFNLEKIFDIITSSNNDDMKSFCKLIRERLEERINLFMKFFEGSFALYGFGSNESKQALKDLGVKLKNIESNFKMDISRIIKKIENEEKYYSYLCEEYLDYEKVAIENVLENLNIPQNTYFKKNNITYHLHLRRYINDLKEMYNSISEKVESKYFLEKRYMDLFETQEDIIIKYKNLKDLEKEFKKLTFKEQQYPRVLGYCDDEEKYWFLKENINADNNVNHILSEEAMYNHLVREIEAFTSGGSFGPQLHIKYAIFFQEVSEEIKLKLKDHKNRSTIKYIFIERE